jgi:hypothetical protein
VSRIHFTASDFQQACGMSIPRMKEIAALADEMLNASKEIGRQNLHEYSGELLLVQIYNVLVLDGTITALEALAMIYGVGVISGDNYYGSASML